MCVDGCLNVCYLLMIVNVWWQMSFELWLQMAVRVSKVVSSPSTLPPAGLVPGAGLADCQTSAQIIDGSVQAAAEVCQSVQTLWQTYKVQSMLQLCVQSGPEAITANNNGIKQVDMKWFLRFSAHHHNFISTFWRFKSYNNWHASSHFLFYQNGCRYTFDIDLNF